MSYVDGFVVPVPAANKEAYREMAAWAQPIFRDHGALRVVECWADDVPRGERTDFFRAVQAVEGEAVVFSWIEWPSREARDEGMRAFMADERVKAMGSDMPFDGRRMIFGGFAVLLDDRRGP